MVSVSLGAAAVVPLWPLCLFALVRAAVTGIAECHRLLAVKQCTGLRDIADVGSRAQHRVHETRFSIDTDAGLHANVPRISLLGLVLDVMFVGFISFALIADGLRMC